jgi:hypothetical protein
MAGHELNPNRDVERRSHTACVSLCDLSIRQSPRTFVLQSAICTLTGCDTAGADQHRL